MEAFQQNQSKSYLEAQKALFGTSTPAAKDPSRIGARKHSAMPGTQNGSSEKFSKPFGAMGAKTPKKQRL